ncbi:MAG TPA: DUF2092 domain-containing protein [Kofleriaceae bacterium]|jgi:hypothetical protein|nr:DUF2092 domain-containing protein [Kofleriaceae bacterium]
MSIINSKTSIVAIVLAVATTATAQPTKDEKPAPSQCCHEKTTEKAAEKTAPIDPEAIKALETMGAFLRKQMDFEVSTHAETDYVLDNGQKVTLAKDAELRARRPDRLRIDVTSDRKQRQYFYDGKTFTLYGQKLGYYSTVAAPPTLNELADVLEDKFALALPMVDLFRWGTDQMPLKVITSAVHVGTEKLDGVATEHYAFRQPGIDWQIWIEKGNRPIPHRLIMTTTDDTARPEYTLAMKWTLNTHHDDAVFTFIPPKDAHKIAIGERNTKAIVRAEQARRRSPNDRTRTTKK